MRNRGCSQIAWPHERNPCHKRGVSHPHSIFALPGRLHLYFIGTIFEGHIANRTLNGHRLERVNAGN